MKSCQINLIQSKYLFCFDIIQLLQVVSRTCVCENSHMGLTPCVSYSLSVIGWREADLSKTIKYVNIERNSKSDWQCWCIDSVTFGKHSWQIRPWRPPGSPWWFSTIPRAWMLNLQVKGERIWRETPRTDHRAWSLPIYRYLIFVSKGQTFSVKKFNGLIMA